MLMPRIGVRMSISNLWKVRSQEWAVSRAKCNTVIIELRLGVYES